MASSCAAVRTSPPQSSSQDPQQQQQHFHSSPVIFRRSQSRVFYDSEISTGTSWEFREMQTSSSPTNNSSPIPGPSHVLYLHNNSSNNNEIYHGSSSGHELSVLRAPDSSDLMIMRESPVLLVREVSSSGLENDSFRGIILPSKDDLGGNGSDGSRNSTGSGGSHRSQDSGFSDSGESRPSRTTNNTSASAGNINNSNNKSGSSLSAIGQRLVNLNKSHHELNLSNNSNISPRDPNRNYLSHNRSVSFQVDQPVTTSTSTSQSPHVHHVRQYESPRYYESPPKYQQPPPPPHPILHHHHHHHERFYSVPVAPSPIPHICGKPGHNSSGTFQNSRDFYGNGGGNEEEVEAERRPSVYEDVKSRRSSSSGMCHQCVGNHHHHHSPSASTSSQYSNYTSTSTSISPPGQHWGILSSSSRSTHLGVPICSSTPIRHPPSSTLGGNNSRVTIMQKIDNFESLNKNKKSLDNNNNSSNGSGNSSSSSCLKMNGLRSGSLSTFHSSPQSPSSENTNSCHNLNNLSGSKSSKKVGCGGRKSSNKWSSTSVSSSGHGSVTSKSSLLISGSNLTSGTVGFSCSGNKTVLSGRQEINNNESWNKSSQAGGGSSSSSVLLPKGYRRVPLRKGLDGSSVLESGSTTSKDDVVIVVKSHFDNDAMRLWLHELRSQTESEALSLLQTKSLEGNHLNQKKKNKTEEAGDEEGKSRQGSSSVVAAIHGISSPMMSIKNVERMASVVSGEFAKICKNIEFGFLAQVPSLVLTLISHVEEFLREFQEGSSDNGSGGGFGNLEKIENKLCRSCRRLNRAAENMIQVMERNSLDQYDKQDKRDNDESIYAMIEPPDMNNCFGEDYQSSVNEVVGGIVTVGNLFSQVVDLRLSRDLSALLDIVERGGRIPAKVALKSFATILADGGNHLCRLASEIRSVRGLLGVILEGGSGGDDYDKIISLRCLATILCVGEAVKDFDRAGGFEIVADFMYERCYSLDLKIEAVSVLTQATDPWIDLESSLYSLGTQLEKIVVSLTCLIDEFKSSEESFLLVVAAISNLTFLEVSSIGILRRCNTVAILLEAVETADSDYSVFVLDHIATILANMAGVESVRGDIVKAGGVEALLEFLQRRPGSPGKDSASEIMACERVQQKSTIAISRLCSEEGVAKFILERGGIHRLVSLSRNEKERNYSDGVLIAALATLRKIISVCGDEVVKGLEAEDLIQPRLLDSFLLYSSRQESYV